MKTTHAEIISAKQNVTVAQEAFNAYINLLRETRNNEFVAKGGCNQCNGYGRVCTWSTLDGSGWDEFGPCQNPTCTAKVTGKNITKGEPGTGPSYIVIRDFAQTAQEKAEYARLEKCAETAEQLLKGAIDKWTPSKGKEIEVIRGTKGADCGDKGIVFWTGVSEYQPYRGAYVTRTLKVGFKTAEGITCWTTSNSCVVINPTVKEDESVEITAKVKRSTEKAYLLVVDKKEMWAPKSACKPVNENTYKIALWFAKQNGLTK